MGYLFDYVVMNETKSYRVPDVIDKIYNDIIYGLYSPIIDLSKKNRISIIKCNISCDVLVSSDRSEQDIVDTIGFPSVEIFRETFKNFLGILPLEFRDRFSNL